MKITELSPKAQRTAIREAREGEWDGKRTYDGKKITKEDIIALELLNDTQYDKDGHFVRYGRLGGDK